MGTDAWRNWRAFLAGDAELENYDDEAQSDVAFLGGPASLGPFTLSPVVRDPGPVGPALVIRGNLHAHLIPELVVDGRLADADSTAYYGGDASDEIAALVSLELGVRLRVAGTSRLSGIHDGTDRAPILFEVPRLITPGRPGREMLPRVTSRPTQLSLLTRLHAFASIDEGAQVELVRAARSYATGLWWANEDANQAWLHLVTAVETAAKHRRSAKGNAVDLLRDLWPQVWAIVEDAKTEMRSALAEQLVPLIKSTRAFVELLVDLAPSPPEPRPEHDSFDWSRIGEHARLVYEYRSVALHSGKPFPQPMLEQPRREPSGALQEAPWGLTSGSAGGIWESKETPMLLSTFEYIAREVLLAWWDELIPDPR